MKNRIMWFYMCDVCNLYIDRFSLCYLLCEKMFDLKKEDHRIEEEDKEAFDAGKRSGGSKKKKKMFCRKLVRMRK